MSFLTDVGEFPAVHQQGFPSVRRGRRDSSSANYNWRCGRLVISISYKNKNKTVMDRYDKKKIPY